MNYSCIEQMSTEEYEELLQPIWDYLAMHCSPEQSDVVFVFGGVDLEVPKHAARLFLDGYAETILVTGSSGPLTKDLFTKSEAEVFADAIFEQKVPRDRVLIETEATNTGQNVEFGMRVLKEQGIDVSSAILVAKPFLMRRCMATFNKQFPTIQTTPVPPHGPISLFVDRGLREFALRLCDEIKRLLEYGEAGFIQPQAIPSSIEQHVELVRAIAIDV